MSKKSFKDAGADLFFSGAAAGKDAGVLTVNPVFKSLIPPLSDEEYGQLEENLCAHGVREAISLWGETIIDGHNRYEIATRHNLPYETVNYEFENESDVIFWIIRNQLGRRNLSVYDRSVLALKLKPIIAEKAKEKQLEEGRTLCQNSDKAPIHTKDELAKIAGVSHDTIARVDKLQKIAAPEVKERLERGEISVNRAYRESMPRKALMPGISKGRYDILYAELPFPEMELEEIKKLEIPAEESAVLFLWTAVPLLPMALEVMSAWGFVYKSQMIWDKESGSGAGSWTNSQHEILLIGGKGDFRPLTPRSEVSSVYREKSGARALKPAYFYGLIERMFPDMRYAELFTGNRHSEKWAVWGGRTILD